MLDIALILLELGGAILVGVIIGTLAALKIYDIMSR